MIFMLTPVIREVIKNKSTRFFVIAAGRRFGKTILALLWLLSDEIKPNERRWFVAPTYKQGKMIAWRFLKMLMTDVDCRILESELTIYLENGAEIAIKGADKADNLRGAGLDRVVMEEYAYMKPDVWDLIVYPMLTSTNGRALFIGTPAGYNHFYDMYLKGGSDGWKSYQRTTAQGGHVSKEEIERARRELDERTFRQEFEASFESYDGNLYYTFDQSVHVAPVPFNPGLPIFLSCDFNKSPMCWIVGQSEQKHLKVVDEIVINVNAKTEQAAALFVQKYGSPEYKNKVVYLTGDSSNNYESIRDYTTDYIIIKNALERAGFKVILQIQKANPNINNRVNIACSLFAHNRISIDSRCGVLIKDLARNESDGKGGKDKSDPNQTHASDAFDYLIWLLFANEFYKNNIRQV